MLKISHLTSAHPRYDTRIYHKMCKSLSKKYKVSLIVADGLGDEQKDNINIFDVGKPISRKYRILNSTKHVFQKALELDSNVYHLHDPELIPIGLKLKKLGKKVIFDSHEDVPKQITAKHYLNNFSKKILSYLYSKFEIYALKKLDYVISATPIIRDKFRNYGIKSIDINNFPILNDFIEITPTYDSKTICYIGILYETRGIKEIVKAIEDLDVKLIIAGKFYDKKYEKEVRSLKGWEKVDFKGFVNKEEIKKILRESIIGCVTLYPTPSYMEAYPVKMFEYMSAGLAIVSSNFPLYEEFVLGNNCGVCVDPLDINAIKKAIIDLSNNLEQVKKMGNNGKKAIKEKYNWENEEKKLFSLYDEVLND